MPFKSSLNKELLRFKYGNLKMAVFRKYQMLFHYIEVLIMILKFNNKIKELEEQNKWNEIVELLTNEWEKDKTDLNNYLCLGTEIWFLIVFYDRLRIKSIDRNSLILKLNEIKNYGFDNFKNQVYFNAIFGYMIYLMPYYFFDGDGTAAAYDEWQTRGKNMMQKAYLKDKYNPVFAALYYNSHGKEEKFKKSSMLFSQDKHKYFSESEEVGSYFIRILS